MFKIKSEHKKKYLKNVSWVFGGFLLRYGLTLVVSVLVARYLKPEGFGMMNYATNLMFIFTPIAFMGMYGIVTRELVNLKYDENKILGTSFILKLVASIAVVIFITILVQFTELGSQSRWHIIIATLSLIASPFGVIDYYFQSKVQSKFVVLSQQIAYIITSLLRLLLIYIKAPVGAFVFMFTLDVAIANGFLIYFYRKQGIRISSWLFDKDIAKIFLRESPKVILTEFFAYFYMRIDQVMIEKMLGYESLGIYTAAVKLCEPFYLLASIITASLFPAIINGFKMGMEEYRARLQKLFNILTWCAILVSIGIQFFSEFIITFLYDEDFHQATPILSLYFWTSIFVFQGMLASQAYMIEHKQKFSAIQTFIGVGLNVGLNFILIPLYNLKGACYASLISYAFSSVILNAFNKNTRMIFTLQVNSYLAIFKSPKALIRQFYLDKQ